MRKAIVSLRLLPTLTSIQVVNLCAALNFMKMEEIKRFCDRHKVPTVGKKGEILDRVMAFLETGRILEPRAIPAASRAAAGAAAPLRSNAKILYGTYKNDDRTARFMRGLVGSHFHFTAFGQDWIKARWMVGNPPTFQEFAEAWQEEYERRKKSEARPKDEWAYLNFMQRYV